MKVCCTGGDGDFEYDISHGEYESLIVTCGYGLDDTRRMQMVLQSAATISDSGARLSILQMAGCGPRGTRVVPLFVWCRTPATQVNEVLEQLYRGSASRMFEDPTSDREDSPPAVFGISARECPALIGLTTDRNPGYPNEEPYGRQPVSLHAGCEATHQGPARVLL